MRKKIFLGERQWGLLSFLFLSVSYRSIQIYAVQARKKDVMECQVGFMLCFMYGTNFRLIKTGSEIVLKSRKSVRLVRSVLIQSS